jgi:hypothetical protein
VTSSQNRWTTEKTKFVPLLKRHSTSELDQSRIVHLSRSDAAKVGAARVGIGGIKTPSNGFTGNVGLSASGLPKGVTASFSPNPATASSTLTLRASAAAARGTFLVTITGTSAGLTHKATVTLTVHR